MAGSHKNMLTLELHGTFGMYAPCPVSNMFPRARRNVEFPGFIVVSLDIVDLCYFLQNEIKGLFGASAESNKKN